MDTEYTVTLTGTEINTAIRLLDAAVRAQGLAAAPDAMALAVKFQAAMQPKEDKG